ncbi:MAG TPA: hypothetical protein VL522_06740, partial [Bordetella sp.]|nr:hypothetical protein [Bordetella sp.]
MTGKATLLPEGGSVVVAGDRSVGDKPFDRFWRKFYTLFRSRRMQHNRHLWPYVAIERDAQGAIS